MFFIDLPPEPIHVVQVTQTSPAVPSWNMNGWMYVVPTLPGNQPYMGNSPVIIVDEKGNEVMVGEGSYKVPGLLEYKNPDYFIIMDEPAFLASGYRLALESDSSEVEVGVASYVDTTETENRFRVSTSGQGNDILNFEKIRAENVLIVDQVEVQSFETKTRDTSKDDLRVQAEVSSEELKIPEEPADLAPATNFSDIKSPLLREAVDYLSQRGIIAGYPDGTFQPDRVINRAEALKIIFAAQGITADRPAITPPFPDVSTTEWFAVYVEEAKTRNLIKGYADGKYRPNQEVNKAEFIKIAMLAQSFYEATTDYSPALNQFSDLDDNEWYMPYVSFAVAKSFLDNTQKLSPTKGMTRGEAAMMIYRILKEQE